MERANKRQYFLLLIVLFFLIYYVGLLRGGNVCVDGKNLINFAFIYCVGFGLRRVRLIIKDENRIRCYSLACIICILFVVFISEQYFSGTIRNVVIKLTYFYHSPGLLLLSICVFLIFQTLEFHNKTINRFAVSALAIYLFHEHPHMRDVLYKDFFSNIIIDGNSWALLMMLLFTVILGTCAIVIDVIRLRISVLISPLFVKIERFFKTQLDTI